MKESESKHASPSSPDGEGVRIIKRSARHARTALLYKVLALVLIGCSVGYLVKMARQPGNDAPSAVGPASFTHESADGSDRSSSKDGDMRDRDIKDIPTAARRDPDDLANYVSPGQPAPTAAEVIDRLNKAGIHSGIGAFSPPGTSPPLIGLAVPDDFVLPEGYVRHFQSTDDGQRIEAILMYSPDFVFYDSAGRRLDIPEDRVVPANQAPPGLAIRPIKIPPPKDARGPRT